jgi:hypothetical protein
MEVSGQLHAPGRFISWEIAPAIHYIGGRVGPRTGLDAVVKKPESLPLPRIELWSSSA